MRYVDKQFYFSRSTKNTIISIKYEATEKNQKCVLKMPLWMFFDHAISKDFIALNKSDALCVHTEPDQRLKPTQ